MKLAVPALLAGLLLGPDLLGALPADPIRLRNQGIAELENEAPAQAEQTFRRLSEILPDDPLGHANLAISLLRQQKLEEARQAIDRALAKAPTDPRLASILAEILHWSGADEEALVVFRRAAETAPRDVVLQYSLYRQATTSGAADSATAAEAALERLAALRPENLVVLLQRGHRARERGDRAEATVAYLRIRELMWQAPAGAEKLMEQILAALEENDMDALRAPALRLENVLKITPMYREGLRELSTGIQGEPLTELASEPPGKLWGEPARVHFTPRRLAGGANAGAALAAGDLDGDEKPEIARIAAGAEPRLEVFTTASFTEPGAGSSSYEAPAAIGLLVADLDNDGVQDLLAYGPQGSAVWRGSAAAGLSAETAAFGLEGARGSAAAVLDFDIEGDLDLLLAGEALHLFRNSLSGPLEDVAPLVVPALALPPVLDAVASDLDRDGDIDLLLAHRDGLTWLDNLRQGRLADRSGPLASLGAVRRVASADLDNDGLPDLVTLGESVRFWRNTGTGFVAWTIAHLEAGLRFETMVVFDVDNDGRLDIALGGDSGVAVLGQRRGGFEFLPPIPVPDRVTALVARDLDGDGDQDLVADGASGLYLLDNEGGNANRYLAVRLRGLDTGNSKNNVFGLGSTVEVRAGSAYQFREAEGEVVHFGLGQVLRPDLVRVVWTNGVPQNRLQPQVDQRIVEEQLLKGSCPFLYARRGDRFEFVTDLLWGAPIGLPIGNGEYLAADPRELVKIGSDPPTDGHYELRITEELWEAAFFDSVRLWVVDHPTDVEVASSLRIQPGTVVPELVLASRSLRPVVLALDARGRNVTRRVQLRDDVYADGWSRSDYQGVAAEPWTFTFDLGAAPAAAIRLHLDGWIFPTDASLNLALAQRSTPRALPPRLEVLVRDSWQPLIASMGFPAGKTKTMVVDTPPLPPGSSRLRIVSGQWLSWDRIAWTTDRADSEPIVVARLEPTMAELRSRGFSALVRTAPNAPHVFDYERLTLDSPWLPFPGRYTRFGDVRELLATSDDRSVVMGPGDEIALAFDVRDLEDPPPGWQRTVMLESHGWDKDADRNTGAGERVEPLPFRAMSTYPYGAGENFPDTAGHRDYLGTWLTREILPAGPQSVQSPAADAIERGHELESRTDGR